MTSMNTKLSYFLSIIWTVTITLLVTMVFRIGIFSTYFTFTGLFIVFIISIVRLSIIGSEKQHRLLDVILMLTSHVVMIGLIFSEILIQPQIPYSTLLIYLFLSTALILQAFNSMTVVDHALSILLAIPIVIITLIAQFLVAIIDIVFPPKFQELVPYIEVTREMIVQFSQMMASETRKQTEEALDTLGSVSGRVEEIAEGYALRKGLGQGIDIGLTMIVFVGFGVLSVMVNDLKIPPQVIAILFASLSLALSTFAGFFGPFYGLAGACKSFTLKHGNYRGATIYKALEQFFSIPFMAASAGFLLLDLPPIDADTLDDFKSEMQEQIKDISDNVNSLLGTDSSAVPRKTRKLIASLMENTEQSLSKLDFRNIREETNREFALTYYQHEFSWKPWKRKFIVKDFANEINFTPEEGEDALKLIGFKIKAGQMDEDLVNNVMVSSALKGVIMMEQKYQELFGDAELGQTCTGLAFGARQFINDHYVVRTRSERIFVTLKNLLIGIFAIPIVLTISLHNYFNRFFDESVNAISDVFFEGRGYDIIKIRANEVYGEIKSRPARVAEKKRLKKERKSKEDRAQRNWQIKRTIQSIFNKIWEVIIFPFTILIGLSKWIMAKFQEGEQNTRQQFEEAVSHAALVSMYKELYKKLVIQTNLSY